MDLRELVTEHLKSTGAEQVMIRPNGNVRVRQNGEWIDAGRVGDYAEIVKKSTVSSDELQKMNTGYGALD